MNFNGAIMRNTKSYLETFLRSLVAFAFLANVFATEAGAVDRFFYRFPANTDMLPSQGSDGVSHPVINDFSGNAIYFSVGTNASYTPRVTDSTTGATWPNTNTSYSINKALPDGLNFNTSSGAISGAPTAASTTSGYQITVSAADARRLRHPHSVSSLRPKRL